MMGSTGTIHQRLMQISVYMMCSPHHLLTLAAESPPQNPPLSLRLSPPPLVVCNTNIYLKQKFYLLQVVAVPGCVRPPLPGTCVRPIHILNVPHK